MLYIFHKHICWTWEGKSVDTSLGKLSILPCYGLGENVKPGADALKQTLKAIIYVICIMQHNASSLTWYAVHQHIHVSLNCPITCHNRHLSQPTFYGGVAAKVMYSYWNIPIC